MIGSVSTAVTAMNLAPIPLVTPALDESAAPSSSAPPSVILALSDGSVTDADPTYAALRATPPRWDHASTDAVTTAMANTYRAASLAGRLAGLGKVSLDRFATDGRDYSQTVRAPGLFAGGGRADMTLSVRTASGSTVTLSLQNDEDGLAVTSRSSASLNEAERAAVAKLADAFQHAIDGFVAIPPKLDLAGLTQFDPNTLSSIDLKAEASVAGAGPQTMTFHADSVSRSVKTTGDLGTIDVQVDMGSTAILGNATQRAAAVDNYLAQFDKAASRGHGNPALMAMFKDAFFQLNTPQGSDAPGLTKAPPLSLSATDHAMMTGLGDFRASVTQTPSASNPRRGDEKDSFSYQVSQQTQIGGRDASNRSVTQRQHAQLTASYHTALSAGVDLMLTDDPKSQNYRYIQIDDSADTETAIAYQKGQLTLASIKQSASQSTHQSTYVMGKLVADTTLPLSRSTTRDLLGLLRPFEDDGSAPTRRKQAEWEQALASIHAGIGLQSDPTALAAASPRER